MAEAKLEADPKSIGAGGKPLTHKSESLWQDGLRRLFRNRAAVLRRHRR